MEMYTKNIKKNIYGFTIIETLVAILIFLIGILGLVSLQISLSHIDNISDKLASAVELAQAKIEEFQSKDDPSTFGNGNDFINEFKRTWTTSTGSANNSYSITVQVGWGGANCKNDISSCIHSILLQSEAIKVD